MKIEDLMSRNVISVSSEETLSHALAKMKKHKIHQLPIIDGNEYKGMIVLRSLVTKRIDPSKSKCSHFVIPTGTLRKDVSPEDASQSLLNAGLRALPVVDNGKIVGILSESDLMKLVSNNKKSDDIMTQCEYVEPDDNVGKVKKIMLNRNVSRVPVLNKGKIVGVVGSLNLINVLLTANQEFSARAKVIKNKGYKEPQPLDKIKVSTVMEEPNVVNKNSSVNDVARILQKEEEVFVMNSVPHVITQKDVLELFLPRQEKGVYVQVMNLHGEDSFTQAKLDSMTTEFVQKIGKMNIDIQSLILHIDRHQKGGKTKYAIRTRLFPGVFVSHAWDWNLVTASQAALDKLEREIKKYHGKVSHHEARKMSKQFRR